MSYFITQDKAAELNRLFLAGESIRKASTIVGVSKITAHSYRKKIKQVILCACGQDAKHKGWCAHRFSKSPKRQAWMASAGWFHITPDWVKQLAKTHKAVSDITDTYPFTSLRSNENGSDLVSMVNAIVPIDLSEDARADISQDMLHALVAGEIKVEELKRVLPRFISKFYKMFGNKRFILSLDAPINQEAGARSLHDLIAHVEGGGLYNLTK